MRTDSAGSERAGTPRSVAAAAAAPNTAATATAVATRGSMPSAVMTGAGKMRAKSASVAAALQDPTNLLRSAPPACPPSLATRTATNAELFQFYALRGHAEVLGSDGEEAQVAVRAALDGLAAGEREAMMAATYPGNNEGTAVLAPAIAGHRRGEEGASCPEKQPVPPPKPTDLSQPLFPRLRPSANDDKHAALLKTQRELEHLADTRGRSERAALPPAEVYYASLLRPATQMTTAMESGMADTIAKASGSAGEPAADARAAAVSTRSGRRPSPGSGGFPDADAPRSSTSTTMGVTGTIHPTATLAQRAALHRESRATLADEIDHVFVSAYYQTHPEELARKQAEEEEAAAAALLGESSRTGNAARRPTGSLRRQSSVPRKKKASTATTAAPKRGCREGAPPENLRFLKTSLLSLCDEQGQITGADVEQLLADVPFEVRNMDALRDLLQMIRQVTEVKQREPDRRVTGPAAMAHLSDNSRGGGGGGAGMENSFSAASRRGGQPGASAYSQQQHDSNSGRLWASGAVSGNTMRRGTAAGGGGANGVPGAGTSRGSISLGGNISTVAGGSMAGAGGGGGGGLPGASVSGFHRSVVPSAAAAGSGSPPSHQGLAAAAPRGTPPGPRLLVREVLGAVHAILNGKATRDIVRWVCFHAVAAEGQGYIHKSTLQALRTTRREECEGPQAEFTASIVKALNDAFLAMAAEEEADYIKKNQKGKRKAKSKKGKAAVKLAANEKSVIPLSVMRRSHMNYDEFCRYFDALPQVSAAFTHVWLGMLLNGHIGAVGDATAASALVKGAETAALRRARVSISSHGPMGGASLAEAERSGGPRSPATTVGATSTAGHDDADPIHLARDGAGEFPPSASAAAATVSTGAAPADTAEAAVDIPAGTFPITLLGPNAAARREAVQQIVHAELAVMREAAEER